MTSFRNAQVQLFTEDFGDKNHFSRYFGRRMKKSGQTGGEGILFN